MRVSSEDVAQRAGVSRSTVSYILNGHGDRFSEATRDAVERAVAELGYRPHSAGRALARGQSDLVLLVLPIAPNSQFSQVADQLTETLAEHGLSLLMCSSTASPRSFAAMIDAARPRVVIALSELPEAKRTVLRAAGVRTLDIAHAISQRGGLSWRAGRLQADHLIQRGYRRLAYARLAEARDDVLLRAREQGVREACEAAGLDEPQVITVALRADADLDAIAALPTGTGLACYNDDTAAAALAAARVIGRTVPRELGVVGVDDTPVATQTSPRLTTISFGPPTSWDHLTQLLLDPSPPADTSLGDLGECHLVQGDST
ncbi:LacI family DNA-binding transcriptional regulator [Nonomuraea bangladeshensis]|uniref:LacI family DNA-binding transcriptional regulator n=1 Tax=Nonomuraea bangladeshensis TaxID=404385 RepID=A0ABV3H0Y3_9ACTN